MRVLFIGTFGLYPKGTVRDRAVPLAEALVGRGHSVTVLVPPWDNPVDSGRDVNVGGVRVVNIRIPRRIPLLWQMVVTFRLLKQAMKEKPDLLHLFKPKAFTGFVAMAVWLAKKLGLVRVALMVDTDDWEGKGGWNDLQNYSWAEKRLFAFQESWVLRHADSVTVASRALENLVADLGVDRERIRYLPNGVTGERLSVDGRSGQGVRQLYNVGQSPVVLLYTRFFEYSLEYLLQVVEAILNQVPDTRLLVVGKGLFGEEQRLEKLSYQRGISSSIIQAGWVQREKLVDYFAAADVAIYPMEDTLINRTKCPVKLADLLAAGVPVVAEGVGECTQYINNGETGLLVKQGDAECMASAVVKLLGSQSLRQRLSNNARAMMASKYMWVQLAERAEEAYCVAIGRS